jgi:class 3 adenylate cyclase
MPWSETEALRRIEKHLSSAPETAVTVSSFSEFMRDRRTLVETAKAMGSTTTEAVWYVASNRAVTTHGAHVYANLLAYNDRLTEAGRETEASHERALQLLNLHYGACDELLRAFDIQRVDFHGSRLHAVVLTPEGPENEFERIERAIAFAAAFREMVTRTGARYGADFETSVRIGIDSGPAIAVNSGRRSEPEPLFIGSPANHAAKLAAGEDPGIFMSPRVQAVRGQVSFQGAASRLVEAAEQQALRARYNIRIGGAPSRLDEAFQKFVDSRDAITKSAGPSGPASFSFHYRQPPLRTIDFQDHPPSNAIRQALVSVFADIDGFTAYVDNAIATGTVARAVANLHVLRSEMAAVLQDDFDGRKIRFIGDCLHGVVGVGDRRETNERESVRAAVLTAAAIRSSFELCKRRLQGVSDLGIAIGLELGPTPLCRVGLPGGSSVRCSSSKATCVSEDEQSSCTGIQTAIGERAYRAASGAVQNVFGVARKASNLTYPAALALIDGVAAKPTPMAVSAIAAAVSAAPVSAKPIYQPMRAHCRI